MARALRCALITSRGDLGHFFIREAVRRILINIRSDVDLSFSFVGKHAPPGVPRYFESVRMDLMKADVIILAGGPILWPYVDRCDWSSTLKSSILEMAAEGKPLYALAMGSCYPIDRAGNVCGFRSEELAFASEILRACRIVTVRDRFIYEQLRTVSVFSSLLPCVSFCLTTNLRQRSSTDTLLINYMHGAGHHDYLGIVNPKRWTRLLSGLITSAITRYPVEILCHSSVEYELAPLLDPVLPVHLPVCLPDYKRLSLKALCAVNNRIHASLVLAGLLVPSLTVGTDSRLLSLAEVGLPTLTFPHFSQRTLQHSFELLVANRAELITRLIETKHDAMHSYEEIARQILTLA